MKNKKFDYSLISWAILIHISNVLLTHFQVYLLAKYLELIFLEKSLIFKLEIFILIRDLD